MIRKQFFPDATLASKLAQDSSTRGISESNLIVDILSEYYGLKTPTCSISTLTQNVFKEVADYVNHLNIGVPFDLLAASKTYRNIDMASFTAGSKTPMTIRASIGRSFAHKIGAPGMFQNVKKSTFKDKNGKDKQRKSVNNALMYERTM